MMKVKTLLKCSVMVVAMMLQFLVLAGIGHCQENSGETVGRKVDSNLDAAKKKLAEWEETVKEWEAKGKKLGKDGREEYLKLKEQFLRQKDDAVAKVKDLHERRAEVTQEVSEKFDKAYKEAEKTFNKIKGLVKKSDEKETEKGRNAK